MHRTRPVDGRPSPSAGRNGQKLSQLVITRKAARTEGSDPVWGLGLRAIINAALNHHRRRS